MLRLIVKNKTMVRRLFVLTLWLVGIHSFCFGISLIIFPCSVLEYFGFTISQKFYATQGGVFHLIICYAYFKSAIDPENSQDLIILACITKFSATIFLFCYYLFGLQIMIIFLSGILDFLMGAAILFLYILFRKQRDLISGSRQMKPQLPSIVITGASGFIGRHFLEQVRERFVVFAIARRSMVESNITPHPNIHWIQWDIGNPNLIEEVARKIHLQGGADFIVHLAAFYNFDYTDNSAYQLTNINGTRNIIEVAKKLKIKRFIFASSLAACVFPSKGRESDGKITTGCGL